MKLHFKKAAAYLLPLLLLALCLAGCANDTNHNTASVEEEPTPPAVVSIGSLTVEANTVQLTVNPGEASSAEIINALTELPELTEIALPDTDMTVEEIDALRRARNGLTVDYTIQIAGNSYGPQATEADLSALDPQELERAIEKLPLLPDLTAIELRDESGKTQLSASDIKDLAQMLPEMELHYSVSLAGKTYDPDATEADLTALELEELDEAINALSLLPNLTTVELTDADGGNKLSMTDVKVLMDALPEEVSVHYTFELFGQMLSTTDTRVEYDTVAIGNEGEEQIRQALDILPDCTYFLLDSCGIDDEIMASIRDDYPDVKVVWRVFVSVFSLLTDEEMVRITYNFDESKGEPLRYCTDVVYLDLGHNDSMYDISFIENMHKLECVILSGAPVSDISVLANCPNLVWLELAYCGTWLKDISVLADHPTLKYLNISYTAVSDISALENVNLERFVCMQGQVSAADLKHFKEVHPDCLTVSEGRQPYGYGWRYDDHGYTYFEYYAHMREVFRYGDLNYTGNRKEKK